MLLLISCEKEVLLEGEPVNIYGGFSRNNSYERFGDFYRQIYFVDSYDSAFTGGAIAPLLALSGYKIVFPSSEGEIIFFDNRELKWHVKLDSDNVASAGMCADPKQNIYVIDNAGKLYSFSIKGKLRWKKYFNKISAQDIVTFSDLLAVNDGIVTASSDGKISKYNFDGKIIWEKRYNSAILKYFPADEKGNIILPLTKNLFGETDTLLFLSSKGKEKWKKYFKNSRIIKPPVFSNNKIYVICLEVIGEEKYPAIYCLNDKGQIKWKKELSLLPRFLSVDTDDNLYIVAYNSGMGKPVSMVTVFNKYGKKVWDKYIEVSITSPLMIAENIIAFIGSDEEASGVYFMRKNGFLENVLSLSEAPILNLQPLVSPNRHILFGGAEKVQILRIDETPMKKFIPW
ncbi:MAG: PQQ-binding-like beta-propeller repeat protein [bacterium]